MFADQCRNWNFFVCQLVHMVPEAVRSSLPSGCSRAALAIDRSRILSPPGSYCHISSLIVDWPRNGQPDQQLSPNLDACAQTFLAFVVAFLEATAGLHFLWALRTSYCCGWPSGSSGARPRVDLDFALVYSSDQAYFRYFAHCFANYSIVPGAKSQRLPEARLHHGPKPLTKAVGDSTAATFAYGTG